jgi:hypothetical protein
MGGSSRSGGARGNAGGDRGTRPSGNIQTGVTPQNSGLGTAPGSVDSSQPRPSRPSNGNILSPGIPNGSNPGSILSPGSPNRPYRPGNIITPGTPRQPSRGITIVPDGRDRHRGGRRGDAVILYYPFSYGYGSYSAMNDGYVDSGVTDPNAIPNGNNTRTNPQATYSIDGLEEDRTREPHSRVYEVGPRSRENGVETRRIDPEKDPANGPAESAESPVTLIALQGGLVYAVTEHWMLGNTVHFVTTQDEHYVVSLQEVDLDLSARLNRERGMKFVLEVRERTHPASAR